MHHDDEAAGYQFEPTLEAVITLRVALVSILIAQAISAVASILRIIISSHPASSILALIANSLAVLSMSNSLSNYLSYMF
jgi:hypothetical protein